ncbi:hypothetical protein LTR62_001199 [Meristemomyces frigidus]|uniref:Uncharacterized protein n=1 Tax=Meristemomyces frigidus TaxID=1508187 RepID=A0AAN7TGC5_9PEZI|nr:hypothetical protein LTR62_001199 [Meristemomyces frigidus]
MSDEEAETMDIDPAIAEAMGFTGFGGRKRKFDNRNEAFVDPLTMTSESAKGANNIPLGSRKPQLQQSLSNTTNHTPAVAPKELEGIDPQKARLQALRSGIKNDRGDIVYFQPGFIENPWKGAEAR